MYCVDRVKPLDCDCHCTMHDYKEMCMYACQLCLVPSENSLDSVYILYTMCLYTIHRLLCGFDYHFRICVPHMLMRSSMDGLLTYNRHF